MSFEIAKAGWLNRESSILRRWKRNWFVLYQDGTLRYFESQESHSAEEAVRMQPECVCIKTGSQVSDVTPPPGISKNCLLSIIFRDKTWNLCAESPDDLIAWEMCLEESRMIPSRPQQAQSAPPPYSETAYPQQNVVYQQQNGAYPQQNGAYPQQNGAYPQQNVAYGYPGQIIYGSHPPGYVVQAPPGQTTVIYTDDPYHRRRRYSADGTDVAMGMMAGAALGSVMFMPLLWW